MPWEPDYLTVGTYKAYARIDDDADDAQIATAIGMASGAVNKQAGRQFGKVAAEAREYTMRYSRSRGAWMAEVDDFQDQAGQSVAFDVAGDGTFTQVIDPAAVVPWPRNAVKRGRVYERLLIRRTTPGLDDRAYGLRVTLPWGWNAVPAAIVGATLLQVNRMHARRDAPFGVVGSPEQGSELRLLARLDPDVVVAVERYRRRAWAR